MRRLLCYLCLAYLVTVFLYLYVWPPETTIQVEDGGPFQYTGKVYQKEYKNDKLILYLRNVQIYQGVQPDLDHSIGKSQNDTINIICYMQDKQEPRLGSCVLIKGIQHPFLEATNPGEFDQAFYQQIQRVNFAVYKAELLYEGKEYSFVKENLYQFRRKLEAVFDRYLEEEDAAVLKAMLLGNKQELSSEKKSLFQNSGIAHILAISGVHISILGMGFYKLLKRCNFPKTVSTVLAILCMCLYGEMVGMNSSALRAITMFVLQIVAIQFKRTYDIKTSLAVVAMGILMEQPLYLYHAGFLLSFSAVLGICCLSEIFYPEKKMLEGRIVCDLRRNLYGGFCVFLVQFPILIHFYYVFPVLSIFINLLIIPMITFILLCAVLCVVTSYLPLLGELSAEICAGICHYILLLCEKICIVSMRFPFSTWMIGERSWWKYVIYYFVLLLLFSSEKYIKEKYGGKIRVSIQLKAILLLLSVVCFASPENKDLEITYLDIGQGDCICIQNKNGNCYLIDGGSSTRENAGTYILAPFLKYKGVERISTIFITHMDQDHVNAIVELLESEKEIRVDYVAIPVVVEKNENYTNLVNICTKRKIEMVCMEEGNQITDGELMIRVLYPGRDVIMTDNNAASFVLQLEYQNFHALFTGDVNEEGELYVSEKLRNWKCDVLKVTHHGSKYSNTVQLLQTIQPKISIISCGENNSYGHPHEETLQRLTAVESQILRTDKSGAVTVLVYRNKWKVHL